ncbi:MAG: hypothetical protein WAK86_04215 [Pseudonocardiaceae bacterium]
MTRLTGAGPVAVQPASAGTEHDAAIQRETLIPLVITLDTEGGACVSGATLDGRWFRPEPVTVEQVSPDNPLYQYYRPVAVELSASHAADARPEDRDIVRPAEPAGAPLPAAEREDLVNTLADASVAEAFSGLRSVGMLRVQVQRLYRQRSTGGKVFLRMEFADPVGDVYDWIVRDIQLLQPFSDPTSPDAASLLEAFLVHLATEPIYISVGLTKPNGRFPGRFRGCHPLVVGVHGATEHLPRRGREHTDARGVA